MLIFNIPIFLLFLLLLIFVNLFSSFYFLFLIFIDLLGARSRFYAAASLEALSLIGSANLIIIIQLPAEKLLHKTFLWAFALVLFLTLTPFIYFSVVLTCFNFFYLLFLIFYYLIFIYLLFFNFFFWFLERIVNIEFSSRHLSPVNRFGRPHFWHSLVLFCYSYNPSPKPLIRYLTFFFLFLTVIFSLLWLSRLWSLADSIPFLFF